MVFELIENFLNWRKYKDNLVLDKYVLQTSTKKELMSKDIKIKNYIMTKKINDFLDFRPSYFNKFRAKKNILLEQFYELLGDYLIENSYYSIKNSYDLTINDFKKDVLVKEIIRDLIIIEFENKQCLLYFGNYQNVDVKEIGDYVMKEHTQFVIFKLNLLEIYSLEELQTYFGLQFRQTNTLRIIDKIIKLFSRQQQIKNIGNQEEKFTALFSKNNINSLKQFEFEKYLYFNENYKIKHTDIVNLASVGSVGCFLGIVTIDMPRNLEKYPKGIPIQELNGRKNFQVYSYNFEKNILELKNCKEVWSNGIKKTYKIKTKNGREIIATANHPFIKCNFRSNLNNNGKVVDNKEYVKLKDLKIGDSLFVFNRPYKKDYKNGEYIKTNFNKGIRNELEHRFIMKQLYPNTFNKFSVVHHKDHNKFNNSIENLELMSIQEHSRHHLKNKWDKGLIENKKGGIRKKGTSYRPNSKDFKNKGFELQKEFNKRNIGKKMNYNISNEEHLKVCGCNGKITYYDKIVSIEYYGEYETYNMEVEDNHNYIANEFFVKNSGKTYTLNLLLLQILFGGNFRRIIYFDTQNSFNETMMNNVNPIYMNRCKYLNDNYFQITDENFYLNELDFVMSVNFLLEVKGYGGADAKASVVKVEYDDHESFKQAVSEILSIEKNKLSVFKDLNKLEDLDSIDKFMKKVKIRKQGSIFDDLETRKQFFAIFTFQDTFFYEVACYLYLQKFKDILYNREDKYTYLFADETQKYLGGAFLKKILLDLVKEKRQFGFRFFYTGLSYNDVNDFMRFTRHRVFNSFNDVFMLNTLKSLSNTPIENIKMPLEKIIHNNDTSEIKKTELDLNLISKEKSVKQLFDNDKFKLTEEEKEKVKIKLKSIKPIDFKDDEFTELN